MRSFPVFLAALFFTALPLMATSYENIIVNPAEIAGDKPIYERFTILADQMGAEEGAEYMSDLIRLDSVWNLHHRTDFVKLKSADFPPTFNWADSGKMTPVTRAWNCWGFWAFSAIATLEGTYKIQRQWEYDLSEQQILSCTEAGCGNGNTPDIAYDYIYANGAILEEQMEYEGTDTEPCIDNQFEPIMYLNNWTAIPNEEAALKSALFTAPISLLYVTAAQDWNIIFDECMVNDTEFFPTNFWVTLVGWDDADTSCEGVGSWICKGNIGMLPPFHYGYFHMPYTEEFFGSYAMQIDIENIYFLDPNILPNLYTCSEEEYEYQFTAEGGTPPYTYTHSFGSPPPGVVLESDGFLHGKTEDLNVYTFGINIQDSSTPTLSYTKIFGIYTKEQRAGDADCNCMYSILDITFLIAFLYSGGPPSPCDNEDVDKDGFTNLLDILYLIQFIYQDGPPPPEK